MKQITFCIFLCIFSLSLLTLSPSARADTVTITPTSWQTGSYTAILTSNNIPVTIQMICVDYSRQGPPLNVPYTATMSHLSDLSQTRRPDLAANYAAATWLYEQMLDPRNAGSEGYIQSAMWSLLNPALGTNSYWANVALSSTRTGWDTTPYIVLTPSGNIQEMVAKLPRSDVPEPAALLLLGTGLATLASGFRKKP